jgi:isopropylmalate/homocitrate/citramalate synthase
LLEGLMLRIKNADFERGQIHVRGVRSPLDAMEPAALRDIAMEPPALYDQKVASLHSVLHDIDQEGTSRAMRQTRPEVFRSCGKDVDHGTDLIPKTTLVPPYYACISGYTEKAM